MGKGMSLHIGLNSVDPDQYEGWDGQLTACEADAKDMKALAKAQGFGTSAMLLSKDATSAAVMAGISHAAKTLKSGDMFLLTYSGHGGQVKDTNGMTKTAGTKPGSVTTGRWSTTSCTRCGVNSSRAFACWCSPTAAIAEPSFALCRRSSPAGRVRAMPRSVVLKVQKAHAALYKKVQSKVKSAEDVKIGAGVLLVSGCQGRSGGTASSRATIGTCATRSSRRCRTRKRRTTSSSATGIRSSRRRSRWPFDPKPPRLDAPRR